jgi:hypothetical protein
MYHQMNNCRALVHSLLSTFRTFYIYTLLSACCKRSDSIHDHLNLLFPALFPSTLISVERQVGKLYLRILSKGSIPVLCSLYL